MKRRYGREFKDDACRLVMTKGYEPGPAAKELGMPEATLRLWLGQRGWSGPRRGASELSGDSTVLQAQVRDLQARLARSEMEKDVLKKATAYFASQNR